MTYTAPFIGINRHRLKTDGKGVTTLAAFYGCPLQCKYCLNPQSWQPDTRYKEFSCRDFYEYVKIDNLYFLSTNGGITFGGGEPYLYAEFIREFRSICGEKWGITLETSLNVPLKQVKMLLPVVDDYIIDIKDMNRSIYQKYTGKSNTKVVANLKWLIAQGKAEKMTVRVPHIPNFNTPEDVKKSIIRLNRIGITETDEFHYLSSIRK